MKLHKHIADLVQIIKFHNIKHVIICPGSRNAPLMQVFTRDDFFSCYSIVDERSAAYVAMGMARELNEPVVIATTSGTATLNLAPAIAEAFYQHIPLIVLTGDRPSEWPPQFSNQVISQEEIFVRNAKHFFNIPFDVEKKKKYRRIMSEVNFVIEDSNRGNRGPVHLNIALNEPLYEEIPLSKLEELPLPKKDEFDDDPGNAEPGNVPRISEALIAQKRILFIAGSHRYTDDEKRSLQLLTEKFQVTVLADNISNFDFDNLISNPDKLLASISQKERKELIPDLVVAFGGQMVSKRTKLFVQSLDIATVVVLKQFPEDAFNQLSGIVEEYSENFFLQRWKSIEKRAIARCRRYFKEIEFCNVAATRRVIEELPSGTILHLGNSGPIRYSQLLHPRADLTYYGNRGTSGIDGCLSTAVGAAMVSPDKLHVLLIGDMSFVYDSNGMWNRKFPPNLKIVILNDNGGGIFSIIEGPSKMPFFEEYQKAHHPVTLPPLVEAFGLKSVGAYDFDSLNKVLETYYSDQEGPEVLEIDTSKCENSRIFNDLFIAIKS